MPLFRVSRDRIAVVVLALACLASAPGGVATVQGEEPGSARLGTARHVVLIVSDDQHWRDYGFMGHPHLHTPHLDRLARESLLFRRGYVPSSLCCPSLASLITGRLPHEHRIVGNDPPGTGTFPAGSPEHARLFGAGREAMNRHLEEWPTLPRLLGAAGFRSLQTGKWWQGDFTRGGFTEGMTRGERHGDDGLAIGRTTLEPIRGFVRGCRERGERFLVWYAPMLPHDPHDPPADLLARYTSVAPSPHVARYWGNVERFDRSVGDLLGILDDEGLARDTLVVFVTDNGWIQDPASARHAPRSKRSPYDGGVRTPIMFRLPGGIAPGEGEEAVSSLDILPTVLTACGAEVPAGLPGVNLLDPAARAARRAVFGECYTHTLLDLDDPAAGLLWRWCVEGRWKLVVPEHLGPDDPRLASEGRALDEDARRWLLSGAPRLFDLAADPDENTSVAAGHPEVVARLSATLDDRWRPAPRPIPAPPSRRAP